MRYTPIKLFDYYGHGLPCRKIGQGHHRVTISLQCCMPSSVETGPPVREKKIFEGLIYHIYGHEGHFGHVTWIIYVHIGPPFLKILHIKIGFDWFQRRRCLNNIHVFSSGAGANDPLGFFFFFFININILSICSFAASFLQFNDIFPLFLIQMHR